MISDWPWAISPGATRKRREAVVWTRRESDWMPPGSEAGTTHVAPGPAYLATAADVDAEAGARLVLGKMIRVEVRDEGAVRRAAGEVLVGAEVAAGEVYLVDCVHIRVAPELPVQDNASEGVVRAHHVGDADMCALGGVDVTLSWDNVCDLHAEVRRRVFGIGRWRIRRLDLPEGSSVDRSRGCALCMVVPKAASGELVHGATLAVGEWERRLE